MRPRIRMSRNLLLFALVFLAGCSNTKYLEDGELLYTGAKAKVEDSTMSRKQRKALEDELEGLARPKPNSKILGMRPKLWAYNIAGEPKKERGLKHWLRNKVGEEPVLFSQVDLEYNANVLESYAENRGYFKARVSADSTRRNKKASAEYTLKPGPRYHIREVEFPADSSGLGKAVARASRRTLLKPGKPYDLDVIKAERERIDSRLKRRGYYYFNPDYILVQVDSTVGKNQVGLKVKIKPETPDAARVAYTIADIVVYPNFSIKTDTINYKPEDVKQHGDFTIIDSSNLFKPHIFDRILQFKRGDIYNRNDHNLSLQRLINMGTFQFVKNEFRVCDTLNTALDAFYYLTPLPRKSLRFEVLGKTNSANFTGSELSINWSNRNFFRGAELFTTSIFGGIEVQVSGRNKGFNVYRIGNETSLTWPRFITPIRIVTPSGFVPRTKVTVGYEFQKRMQLYALNSFKGSFGYLWRESETKEHQLNLTEITYVSPNGITDLYREQLDANPNLAKAIEKQLIFGPNYSYTFTNTMKRRLRNTIYYKGSVDLSAPITGLIMNGNAKKGDVKEILGVPFSQYVRVENDFRHYLKLGQDSQLASRIIGGVGYSFGNSTSMPFIKQFFIGGTNSIRAFRARSIGPGSYFEPTDANSFLPDQSGDVKIEVNTEYRTKLFSIVHGALFVDVGNIWLLNKDENRPGAEFSGNFLKEFAVGTGAGLRLDISFLVLRLDLAFPLRKPYLPENERWVLDEIDFAGKNWRKNNLVFNLAIGYPF